MIIQRMNRYLIVLKVQIWQDSRHRHRMIVRIRENSWLARLAAKKLGARQVAMVFGNTIHLFNATREEFLRNQRWVNHELAHVKQYAAHGRLRFLWLYLLESIRKGYRRNRFEVEARKMEKDPLDMKDFIIR